MARTPALIIGRLPECTSLTRSAGAHVEVQGGLVPAIKGFAQLPYVLKCIYFRTSAYASIAVVGINYRR